MKIESQELKPGMRKEPASGQDNPIFHLAYRMQEAPLIAKTDVFRCALSIHK